MVSKQRTQGANSFVRTSKLPVCNGKIAEGRRKIRLFLNSPVQKPERSLPVLLLHLDGGRIDQCRNKIGVQRKRPVEESPRLLEPSCFKIQKPEVVPGGRMMHRVFIQSRQPCRFGFRKAGGCIKRLTLSLAFACSSGPANSQALQNSRSLFGTTRMFRVRRGSGV